MTLDSISFVFLFLPLAILVFRVVPVSQRVTTLVVFSWIFYALSDFSAALILVGNSVLDFLLLSFLQIYLLGHARDRRAYPLFAVKAVAALLLIYLYGHWHPTAVLGSFVYTATLLGYLWDLSQGKAAVFGSYWDFALFTTFFAKAPVGPVVRYERFVPQFSELRSSATQISRGAVQFVIGLAKKVLIFDGILGLYQELAAMEVENYTLFSGWLLVFSTAMAIFFFISAYSDMARGLCSMFSLTVPRVIYYPFQAKSFVECVSRINMPLYDLVLDVVSGSAERVRAIARYKDADTKELVAIFSGVMVVALWMFRCPAALLWGIFFFLLILAERYLYFWLIRYIPGLLQAAFAFGMFLFSLALVALPVFSKSLDLIPVMVGLSGRQMISDETNFFLASNYLVVLLSLVFFTSLTDRLVEHFQKRFPVLSEWALAVFNCSLLLLTTALML